MTPCYTMTWDLTPGRSRDASDQHLTTFKAHMVARSSRRTSTDPAYGSGHAQLIGNGREVPRAGSGRGSKPAKSVSEVGPAALGTGSRLRPSAPSPARLGAVRRPHRLEA